MKSENLLDVLNCNDSEKQVIEHQIYRCPTEGKQYGRHRDAKYFGVYHNKRVSHIAEIIAVIDVLFNDDSTINTRSFYTNGFKDMTLDEMKRTAVERLKLHGEENQKNRVFLLKNVFETNFMSGSVPWQEHNRVFDISGYRVSNSQELAAALDGKFWDEVPRGKKPPNAANKVAR